MQQHIAGYRLEAELHQGQASLVYRAVRLRDGRSVVVKTLKNEFPTPQETERYEREFRVAGPLRLSRAVRVLELTRQGHRSVLVYEDDGCVSLDRLYVGRALDTAMFLRVAIAATQALVEVHAHPLIHGDVNPGNLLVDIQTGHIKLTDFELARDPDTAIDETTRAMGTLAYMAPEQSGRARLHADSRADLYALGATLFELACGRRMFVDMDDVSLLHAHFAVAPPSICDVNIEFPPILDAVVQKLLAKMPAQRYQSAEGLLSDLMRVQRKWQHDDSLNSLSLGQSDHASGLVNTDRMIGREHLLAELHAGREGATRSKNPVWIQLRGAAGSGKSTLAARFADSLPAGALVLSGRGQAQSQSVPYAALVTAFDCLLRHWLAVPEAEIVAIRAHLHAAVGTNLGVLEPLLPRLESIVGNFPALPPLQAGFTQTRFPTRRSTSPSKAVATRSACMPIFITPPAQRRSRSGQRLRHQFSRRVPNTSCWPPSGSTSRGMTRTTSACTICSPCATCSLPVAAVGPQRSRERKNPMHCLNQRASASRCREFAG